MHLRKAAEDVSVLKMRCSINADTMTKAELHQKLKTGYRDIGKGRVRNASKAFEEWQRKDENMQIEIQIPKAVLFDVKYTVEQATNFAKKEVALGFYMQKGVSVALCSQIAGMSEKEFLVEVKDRK